VFLADFLFLRLFDDVHEDEALGLAKYINALGTGTTIAQDGIVFVGDHEIPSQYMTFYAESFARGYSETVF
jgi:hypothetical protein